MYNRLYVHVPFCINKCHYCAFVSAPPEKNDLLEYPNLLIRELQLNAPSNVPLTSIYFGGGTPSLLQPQQLARLLEEIAAHSGIKTGAEITLEANPGTVDLNSLQGFRAAGINRISLGMQSFDDSFLQCLGRVHTVGQSCEAFEQARKAGFSNISIDLIHSLPDQTLDQWRSELHHAIEFSPEHISIYGLTVEEGTPFALSYPPNSPNLADEDLSADMFELADELLTQAGFDHYEIANYAKPGRHSQHNSGYWKRDGYLGLGVAAHSFLRDGYGVRFSNPGSLAEYRHQLTSGRLTRNSMQRLTEAEAMSEFIFLGLRLSEGLSRHAFEQEFGRSLEAVYGATIFDLVQLGLLIQTPKSLTLTPRGILLSNQVFSRFL